MEALVHQKRSLVLVLVKNTKCCWTLHYNVDSSYLLVNGKEIFKFKADNENINFPKQFCLGIISNGFTATGSIELCLNEYV